MNELKTVTINQTDITVKEYQGKRVVTLKEVDACHGRPDGTAGRNFRTNSTSLRVQTTLKFVPTKFVDTK